jgi:hypothetical protein
MQSASDKEFSVMKRCRNMVETVRTASGRKRVVDYLLSSLEEMRDQEPQEPKQVKLFAEPEVTGAGHVAAGLAAGSLGNHP